MRTALNFLVTYIVLCLPLHAQRVYVSQDALASQCSLAEALACSGGSAGNNPQSCLVDESGTAGTVSIFPSISTNDSRVLLYFESDDVSDTSWESGNWVARFELLGSDPDGVWDNTTICRVNSDCSSVLATVGQVTSQGTSLASTGVKSHTVSGAAQTASSSDLFLIVLTFRDTSAHGNMTVEIVRNQNIDTPLVAATPSLGGREGIFGNPITY